MSARLPVGCKETGTVDKSSKGPLGYDNWATGAEGCFLAIADHIVCAKPLAYAACLNPHSYVRAERQVDFKRALQSAAWLLADGVGVFLAANLDSSTTTPRITGRDLFHGVHDALRGAASVRVFFLGSSIGVLSAAAARLVLEYPNTVIAGMYAPPMFEILTTELTNEILEKINDSPVDVLWVSLTAPKQELLIFELRQKARASFAGAIGAIVDYYGGRVSAPPTLVRRLGLEWLYRLIVEPRRLWRRTVFSAPLFLYQTIRNSLLRHRKSK
jgi:N-acetylglucosaminyldiphosphoundecaprenol N-acetyl-beta-D-mannosaminyltransferase